MKVLLSKVDRLIDKSILRQTRGLMASARANAIKNKLLKLCTDISTAKVHNSLIVKGKKGNQSNISGNKPNKLRGPQPQKKKKVYRYIYMAMAKPAYRIVGLQERKVGGKKKKSKQNLHF